MGGFFTLITILTSIAIFLLGIKAMRFDKDEFWCFFDSYIKFNSNWETGLYWFFKVIGWVVTAIAIVSFIFAIIETNPPLRRLIMQLDK